MQRYEERRITVADRIKVSTEVLKKWAQDLKAIQTDFN